MSVAAAQLLVLSYEELLDHAKKGDISCVSGAHGDGSHQESQHVLLQALGPGGLGLVAVHYPGIEKQRSRLLRLARSLAKCEDRALQKSVLKAHSLGTDVSLKKANRPVSSFTSQLRFHNGLQVDLARPEKQSRFSASSAQFEEVPQLSTQWSSTTPEDFSDLGQLVRTLGELMVHVGQLLARALDTALGNGGILENAITEARTAKARLIHYHALSDDQQKGTNSAASEAGSHAPPPVKCLSTTANTAVRAPKLNCQNNGGSPLPVAPQGSSCWLPCHSCELSSVSLPASSLWQQWHYDYGLLTALAAPAYYEEGCQWEVPAPSATTGLHVLVECWGSGDRESCIRSALVANSPSPSGVTDKLKQDLSPADAMCALRSSCECTCEASEAERRDRTNQASADVACAARGGGRWGRCGSGALEKGMDSASLRVVTIDVPRDCLLFQVGEAAHILSGGRLSAAAHHVRRPSGESCSDFSREMFVVFLQPSWDCLLSLPRGVDRESAFKDSTLQQALAPILPPLQARWEEGLTFADFARRTTSQYYGSSGKQAMS